MITEQEKQLLLKDLCGRLSYGVKGEVETTDGNGKEIKDEGVLNSVFISDYGTAYICIEGMEYELDDFKPYLLPMSNMTEKEYETFPIPFSFDSFSTWNNTILSKVIEGTQILIGIDEITEIIDWLNAHHFDYHGLIEKGLAIEAPEGMYKSKTE